MQDWIKTHIAFAFPVFFVFIWIVAIYSVALIGGWRLLAKRFRLQGAYQGQKWWMQSARMRWSAHYNGVLTVGANDSGLFLATFFLFRSGHPPLFIPWIEIAATPRTQLFFFKVVELRLGRCEEIPLTISSGLAAKMAAAAGPSWPAAYTRAGESPPPPIG